MDKFVISDDKQRRKFDFWWKGPVKHIKQLMSSEQNEWKTSITACLDEFKHTNIPELPLLTVKSFGVFFSHGRWMQLKPRWRRHSPAFLTAACWLPILDDKSVTVKRVPLWPTEGQCWVKRGPSTVNKSLSVRQTPCCCSVGGLQLRLSERSIKFTLSLRAQARNHPQSEQENEEEEGNLPCCFECHWGVLLGEGEGGRRTGGRS